MRTAKHRPWLQFLLCAASAALAAILYLTTPQKPPELSNAEWTMRRAHMLWEGYLIWFLICASFVWFVEGCWRLLRLVMKRGEPHDEA